MSKGPKIHLDEGYNNRHTYGGLGDFVTFKNAASLYYSPETGICSLPWSSSANNRLIIYGKENCK
jgi:hypothetical protein